MEVEGREPSRDTLPQKTHTHQALRARLFGHELGVAFEEGDRLEALLDVFLFRQSFVIEEVYHADFIRHSPQRVDDAEAAAGG